MQSTLPKDKIILDVTDNPDLLKSLSQLEPGEELSGQFVATLDENADKLVILSIDGIAVDEEFQDRVPDEAEDAAEEAPAKGKKKSKSAAEKVMESQAEDGMGVTNASEPTPLSTYPTQGIANV